MSTLPEYLQAQLPLMTGLLAELGSIESQTDDKAGVDRVGAVVARQLDALGADVTIYPQAVRGDHVLGTWNRGGGGMIVLILHMDTVHPAGTLVSRPVRID